MMSSKFFNNNTGNTQLDKMKREGTMPKVSDPQIIISEIFI